MAEAKGKGSAFFQRAEEIAGTGNWDYAIEVYLQGIAREPENVEQGHQPLRHVALQRKLKGGKPAGMMDKLKHRPSKDPIESLVNAEYLLSKDPGNVGQMMEVLKAAHKAELPDVVNWIGNLVLETQRAGKPNKGVLLRLTEAFDDVENYQQAVQACQMALQLAPNDQDISAALSELRANWTIQRGRYGQEGDFTKSVKDMERQKDLMASDSMVKGEDYLEKQIEKTRAEYLASPDTPGKINAYVDALLQVESEATENQAIDVLTKAHQDTKAYQFKMRIGEIKMRQGTRRYRAAVEAGETDRAKELARQQLEFELEEYAERAVNYPTDLNIKYELGRRQMLAGQLDEAIASLQQAQRDPRHRARAMTLLGQAFAKKGWTREAADTFQKALEGELSEQREKELRYSLAEALEEMDRLTEAGEEYSRVAQLDYNYKDVRERIDRIRQKADSSQQGPPAGDA